MQKILNEEWSHIMILYWELGIPSQPEPSLLQCEQHAIQDCINENKIIQITLDIQSMQHDLIYPRRMGQMNT